MKIVHISIYPQKNKKHSLAGGVASYTKNLVENVHYQNNDEIFILCNKLSNFEEYTENNIKVIRCFDRNPKFLFQILKEIKKIKPDVVHIQQELALFGNIITAYMLQWLIFLLKKEKVVVTLHGVVSLRNVNKNFVKENNSQAPVSIVKLAFKIIFKPICWWSKKIIVHEECFKRVLIEEYNIAENKIEVIPHGVEDFKTISKEKSRSKLNLESNRNAVLFMGYLTGYKGVDLLIDGFSEYAKKNQQAFLLIGAGKHPKLRNDKKYLLEYSRLVKKAEDLISADQYRWVGFIDEANITDYFSASDLSIYPYTIQMSSSGPMAIAIGHEKTFLVSDVFGEIFNDLGLSFERTTSGLCNKLDEFFNEPQKYNNKIENLKKERSWYLIGERLYELYSHL